MSKNEQAIMCVGHFQLKFFFRLLMHSIIYRSMKDLCSKFLSNRLAACDQPILPFGHAAWRYIGVDISRI